ncbi:hypothetical protein DACRYDRAFT_109091 [Dacryopinax primogenitus]|uniref:Aminoglycoside phosphotransferase domain-containing protein n=1 Tax=Dacryopinax primogenitus (strain DJM 731) TaxID=1858805 RepID=M5FX77_DACPD|nr:uncharacterized protein DACRYDRAFT_109091 [Dacryopinax primogenitus]EJU00355.1 hypothetical protein DACRYDRAFT_109091 [Dacryopinax primogenitus]
MHGPTTALKRPQEIPPNWRDFRHLTLSEEEVDYKGLFDPSFAHQVRLGIELPALAFAACMAVDEWNMVELTLLSIAGVSSKLYLIKFGSGRKIVGRIRITPMDSLSELQKRCYRERLESEVATLTYVRLFCSDIPTPVVWAWNGSAENAVGAPYVLLDYVEGETLEDVWHNCSDPTEKTTILQEVAKHHAALAKAVLPFRGFGALRFTSVVGEERLLNDTDFRLGPFLSEGRHFRVTKSRRLVSPPPTAALSPSDLWRDLLVEERRSHLICWGAVPETSVVLPKDDIDSPVNVDVAWNDIQAASKLVERLISATRVPPWLCSPCFSISDYAFRNVIYDPGE